MRNQNENPLYLKFKHLLPESGLYPAQWVVICWNEDEDRKVKDVEVVLIPRGKSIEQYPDGLINAWSAYFNARWSKDLGNSLLGWMEPRGLTPGDVFGMLLKSGFSSKEEAKRAVEEFAGIAEAEWARQVLRGLNGPYVPLNKAA